MIKPYLKRDFACMLDSEKEIEQLNKKEFKSSCMFVLASTDVTITAKEILREYKTQSSVEKSFSSLSPLNLLIPYI